MPLCIASGKKSDVKGAHPRTVIVPPGTGNVLVEFNLFKEFSELLLRLVFLLLTVC